MKKLPSVEYLRQRISIDEDGVMWWRDGKAAGKRVGLKIRRSDGYAEISLNGVMYQAARLAYKVHMGRDPVGHVHALNGLVRDYRASNLFDRRDAEKWPHLREWREDAMKDKRAAKGHAEREEEAMQKFQALCQSLTVPSVPKPTLWQRVKGWIIGDERECA